MRYNHNSIMYFNEDTYITCPHCNCTINMIDKGIWHNDHYMCNNCLKYFEIKFYYEITKYDGDE